jgi:uncharacterized protein (DUF362 family)
VVADDESCYERGIMADRMDRRHFLQRLLVVSATGALGLSACTPKPAPVAPTPTLAGSPSSPVATQLPAPTAQLPTATGAPTVIPTKPAAVASAPTVAVATDLPAAAATVTPAYLAVVHGPDPAELTRRAVAAIGGIERFMKKGAEVIVKPNICTSYHTFEYASTTNPVVVATLVKLCLAAGAKRVRVMDLPFGGTPQAAYTKSGIADAVKAAGGEMEVMSALKYRSLDVPQGKRIKKWDVYGDIMDADLVINVPIAKNHSAAGLTLGMKNLMGLVRDRDGMHARGLHQAIADVATVVRPQLTIVDAVRILTANGPTGGNLNDVKKTDTLIASTDVVAADAYATTLFGMTGKDIDYIRFGAEMGLGEIDLTKIKIEEINA